MCRLEGISLDGKKVQLQTADLQTNKYRVGHKKPWRVGRYDSSMVRREREH